MQAYSKHDAAYGHLNVDALSFLFSVSSDWAVDGVSTNKKSV